MRSISLLLISLGLLTASVFAQDAVKVDPQHYKVEFENDQVRVLRIHYGPHENQLCTRILTPLPFS